MLEMGKRKLVFQIQIRDACGKGMALKSDGFMVKSQLQYTY